MEILKNVDAYMNDKSTGRVLNKFSALGERLVVITGDIINQPVDAMVNAASHFLVGMDGCSGTVLKKGGSELVQECASLGGCEEGDAKLTRGYHLPAQWVIHAVAPVWRHGYDGEEIRLKSCYRRSFELAVMKGCRTISFPSLGTGGHACPASWAVPIAVREIEHALQQYQEIEQVVVVCYEDEILRLYDEELQKMD